MDKNFKFEESVPKNLQAQIKDKLINVLNDFEELCDTLQKLGITFKPNFKSFNLNALSKDGETANDKAKVKNESADLFHVTAVTHSSSSTSTTFRANTSVSEVAKFISEETKTTRSKINGSDASTIGTDFGEFSDCSSDVSSTDVNLSNEDLDEYFEEISKSDSNYSLNSKDISESDSVISSRVMLLKEPYRIGFCDVKSHSDGYLINCFSETAGRTVKPTSADTDISVTSDQTSESLIFELISSNDSMKDNGAFSHRTQNFNIALKSTDRDQESYFDKLCSNECKSVRVDMETNDIKEELARSHLYFDNDLITAAAYETKKNETFGTDKNLNRNRIICGGVKEVIEFKGLLKDSNPMGEEYLNSPESDSESCYSALKFSDSDAESCSSKKTFSDSEHENILHTLELRKVMNNNDYFLDRVQEATIQVENSFFNDSDLDNHSGTNNGSDKTKIKKEEPENFAISDENWNCLPLLVKFIRDPDRTFDEGFSSNNITESKNSSSDLCHSNEEHSENNQESHIDEKSPTTDMLNEVRSIIKNILSQSEFKSDLSDKGYQNGTVFSNESSKTNLSLCNSRRNSVSSDYSTDSEPETLDNIFKKIVKCHPISNLSISSYASINDEVKWEVSCKKDVENRLPLHGIDENRNFSEFTNSHSVVTFEYDDCFNKNSSIICGALLTNYLNTAVNINILLIKKAKDVSTEDYNQRLDTLHCLDDELGYLSAKLITVRNDWEKTFCDIDQNIRGNPQWRMRSPGLYYMGMIRVCMTLTKTLFQFCLEKQLELEEYENELIYYHGCRN